MFTKDIVMVDTSALIRIMEPSPPAEMNAQVVLVRHILRIIPIPTTVHATQAHALMMVNIKITRHIVLLEQVRFESSQRNLFYRE